MTLLARAIREMEDGSQEELCVYGASDHLSVYMGVRYPGARSSMVNTGGSRRLSAEALRGGVEAALRPHERPGWALLSEAERSAVRAWAQGMLA